MTGLLLYIFYYSQCFCMLLSFLFSLKLICNKNIPYYMKGFFWYPTIGLIVMLPSLINAITLKFSNLASAINNFSLVFHYIFLSVFIIRVMPKKKELVFLYSLFSLFLILIVFFLITNPITKQINQAFSICNFGLTIFCIIYYYKIFNNIPIISLWKEASFWIITGIFFCMAMNIPVTATIDYLHKRISLLNMMLLNSIITVSYGIMHLFFIKAYICAFRIQKA